MGKVLLTIFVSLLFQAQLCAETQGHESIQLLNQALEHKSIGVLLNSNEKAKGSLCTVTHLALGKVLTSASCVSLSSDPSHYSLVFVNKEDNLSVISIEKIFFTGPPWIDIAILTISQSNAKNWEVAGNEIKTYAVQNVLDQYWNDSTETESVEVWGYRPTEKVGSYQFVKNKCTAARKIPVIEMKVKDNEKEKSVHEWQVTGEEVNPDHVFFLDNCTHSTPSSNGSLITVSKSFSKKVGVLSLYSPDLGKIHTMRSQSQYKEQEVAFYYKGLIQPFRSIANDFSDLTVQMGTMLQSASALKKDLFQHLY